MTEPGEPTDQPYPSVPARADLPTLERRLLDRWADQRTFERSVEQRPASRATAPTSTSSTTARRSPTASPTTATCSPATSRTSCPATRPCAASGSSAASAGTATACRPRWRPRRSSASSGRAADHRVRHRALQRRTAARRCCATPASGSATSPARPAGSTSTNDYKTMDLSYMESRHLGVQAAVGQGPASTRPTGSCPTPGGPRRRCRTSRSASTTPPAPARTRRSPSPSRLEPAERRRPGRRCEILAWTTTPWTLPSNLALAVGPEHRLRRGRATDGPTSTYVARRRGRRASATAQELGEAHTVLATVKGAGPGRAAPTSRCSRTSPATANSFRVLAGRLRRPTDEGTGVVHLAPGFGEDDQRVCEAAGIALVVPGRRRGPLHRRGARLGGPERLRRQPARSSRHLKDARRRGPPRHLRPQLPALLAHRHADHLQGHVVLVRARSPTFRDRLVELNQEINWIPDHVRDGAVRQVARGRPRLVDQPQPLLGLAHPGLAQRRPRLPPHRRVRLARRDRARLRRAPDRPAPARPSTSSSRPNPDDPTGQLDDAPRPRGARLLVRVGLDALRAGALPVREQASGSTPTSPADFIVEYIAQTRGWFYTLHVLCDGAVRPPAVPERDLPRRRARRTTAASSPSGCATTPTPTRCSRPIGADALRWYLMASPILRGGDLRIDTRRHGHRRRRPPGAQPDLERVPLLHALRERRRLPGAGPHRRRPALLDRYILAKTRDAGRGRSPSAWTPTTSPAPAPRSRPFLDALNNWYIRRSRDRFWAPGSDADGDCRRTRPTPTTRSTRCSPRSPGWPHRCCRC